MIDPGYLVAGDRERSGAMGRAVAEHEVAEHERARATGTARVPVVPIDLRANPTPVGPGMVIARVVSNEHLAVS